MDQIGSDWIGSDRKDSEACCLSASKARETAQFGTFISWISFFFVILFSLIFRHDSREREEQETKSQVMEAQSNGWEDVMETMSSTMASSATPSLASMGEGKFTVEDIVKQPVGHSIQLSRDIDFLGVKSIFSMYICFKRSCSETSRVQIVLEEKRKKRGNNNSVLPRVKFFFSWILLASSFPDMTKSQGTSRTVRTTPLSLFCSAPRETLLGSCTRTIPLAERKDVWRCRRAQASKRASSQEKINYAESGCEKEGWV